MIAVHAYIEVTDVTRGCRPSCRFRRPAYQAGNRPRACCHVMSWHDTDTGESLAMTEPIFWRAGEAYRPTGNAVGPWSPKILQGSATAGLMAAIVESLADGMLVARLTFNLWRPAGLDLIGVEHEILRESRQTRVAEVRLLQQGEPVARCTAVLLRSDERQPPPAPSDPPPDGPDVGAAIAGHEQALSPFFRGVEVRMARGRIAAPGPAAAWLHLARPFIDDEPASALVQAVSAADLVGGISQILHPRDWLFSNPDLDVVMWRRPASDWILLDASTEIGPEAIGTGFGILSDRAGAFGRCSASLLFRRRPAAAVGPDARQAAAGNPP